MTGHGHANHEAITDIADEVQVKMASYMRGAPVLQLPTTNEDSRCEEEATTSAHRKWGLKSGKIYRADTTVIFKITWPHEVIYSRTGQCAEYVKMSATLFFFSRFLMVMAGEKIIIGHFMLQHLKKLKGDVELYGWQPPSLSILYGSNNWSRAELLGPMRSTR